MLTWRRGQGAPLIANHIIKHPDQSQGSLKWLRCLCASHLHHTCSKSFSLQNNSTVFWLHTTKQIPWKWWIKVHNKRSRGVTGFIGSVRTWLLHLIPKDLKLKTRTRSPRDRRRLADDDEFQLFMKLNTQFTKSKLWASTFLCTTIDSEATGDKSCRPPPAPLSTSCLTLACEHSLMVLIVLIANNENNHEKQQQPFQTYRSLFISQKKNKKIPWPLGALFPLWSPSLTPKAPPSQAPWECEGWNDTQWLTVAQGSGFWPWLAGSVWQLVSPLPSFWPAASTVVVVGLIGATLWSLTLGLTLNCSAATYRLVARKSEQN